MGTETRSRGSGVLIGFLLIVGFFLLTEHRAHTFGLLPYLLLLACVLLHSFMHGRHGGHGGRRNETRPEEGHSGHHLPERRAP